MRPPIDAYAYINNTNVLLTLACLSRVARVLLRLCPRARRSSDTRPLLARHSCAARSPVAPLARQLQAARAPLGRHLDAN